MMTGLKMVNSFVGPALMMRKARFNPKFVANQRCIVLLYTRCLKQTQTLDVGITDPLVFSLICLMIFFLAYGFSDAEVMKDCRRCNSKMGPKIR